MVEKVHTTVSHSNQTLERYDQFRNGRYMYIVHAEHIHVHVTVVMSGGGLALFYCPC